MYALFALYRRTFHPAVQRKAKSKVSGKSRRSRVRVFVITVFCDTFRRGLRIALYNKNHRMLQKCDFCCTPRLSLPRCWRIFCSNERSLVGEQPFASMNWPEHHATATYHCTCSTRSVRFSDISRRRCHQSGVCQRRRLRRRTNLQARPRVVKNGLSANKRSSQSACLSKSMR